MAFKIYDYILASGRTRPTVDGTGASTPLATGTRIPGTYSCEVDDREFFAMFSGVWPTGVFDKLHVGQTSANLFGTRLANLQCPLLVLDIENVWPTSPQNGTPRAIGVSSGIADDATAISDFVTYCAPAASFIRQTFNGLVGDFGNFPGTIIGEPTPAPAGTGSNSLYSLARYYNPAQPTDPQRYYFWAQKAPWEARHDLMSDNGWTFYYNALTPVITPVYPPNVPGQTEPAPYNAGNPTWSRQEELDTLKRMALLNKVECDRINAYNGTHHPIICFHRPYYDTAMTHMWPLADLISFIEYLKEIGYDGIVLWDGGDTVRNWTSDYINGGYVAAITELSTRYADVVPPIKLYTDFIKLANYMIGTYGKNVTFKKMAVNPNPSQPWRGSPNTFSAAETLKAFITDFTEKEVFADSSKRGKKKAYVSGGATASKLETFDTVIDVDGKVWHIEGPTTIIEPATTRLLYCFTLKK